MLYHNDIIKHANLLIMFAIGLLYIAMFSMLNIFLFSNNSLRLMFST